MVTVFGVPHAIRPHAYHMQCGRLVLSMCPIQCVVPKYSSNLLSFILFHCISSFFFGGLGSAYKTRIYPRPQHSSARTHTHTIDFLSVIPIVVYDTSAAHFSASHCECWALACVDINLVEFMDWKEADRDRRRLRVKWVDKKIDSLIVTALIPVAQKRAESFPNTYKL